MSPLSEGKRQKFVLFNIEHPYQLKKQIIYLLKKTRYTLLISQPCFSATDNISNIIE